MIMWIGILGVVAAVAAVVWAVGTQLDERATIRMTLRRLDGYDVTSTRDQELLVSIRDRAIAPAFDRALDLGRRLTPVGYVDNVRRKHVQAGIPKSAVDDFLVKKVLAVAATPLVFVLVFAVLRMSGVLAWGMAAVLVLLLLGGADAMLDRKVEARTYAIRIALPDILDLLVISVEAGLGFEQALDRTVDAVPGPLTDEFARMLGEIRAGASRSEAMRMMETRLDVPEVRSFILAILQADTFGVSIGRVLRAQSEEMRIKRRQYAQEAAQKAPVKMLIPMVFCIFPALFVVVLGPAVINIIDNFS